MTAAAQRSIDGAIRKLEIAVEVARRAEESSLAALADRDDAVRTALDQGVRVHDIQSLTGLSRARIYQIRDRRR